MLKNRSILFAMIFLIVVSAAPAFAQQNPPDNPLVNTTVRAPAAPIAAVGRQGWVTFKADTKLGDTVLKPATYYAEHGMRGASHVVSFQQTGDPDLALQYSDQGLVGQPVSVKCQLENLPQRLKRTATTTVADGTERRITRIEIKGESVAHFVRITNRRPSEAQLQARLSMAARLHRLRDGFLSWPVNR